ncbi:MAG: group 1 glycosyl transferase [Candidatus Gottesmanbacteria bacterium GW2011_GWA2_43_14]|uniref:Group 1 glycosyl transferase n=1 Tax=Candidatus Gottesmanbacteria bacterium GW2011_GWA2_43_14 TaxID=1618443 RepID=A0A0G1GAU8_9BACT|nr:MAG: group 1 glycosyl transferase [Candidatus Gottesmanbacteria bacterium GW2011_GWA2_43_14]
MKICYVFSGIYQANIIGQSGVALRLIENIKKYNNDIYLISNYLSESDNFDLKGKNNLLLKGPNTLNTYLRNTLKIVSYLRKLHPNILHVRGLLIVPFMWVINKLFLGYPIVFSIFETPEHLKSHFIYLIAYCINHGDGTFVSSNFIKKKFVEKGALPEKIFVRYTGIKDKFLVQNKLNSTEDNDVLFFGDSSKERGFDIVCKLAKKMPKVKFKVLLRWQAKNCHIELEKIKNLKNTTIWYYPYKKNLEEILSNTKLIILPFRYMGMRPPISLLEAMALSKCVITSTMGGNKEFINNNKNGFVMNISKISNIEKKILFLLKNQNVRKKIGDAANRTIRNLYSKNEYKKIADYYTYIKEDFYERRMFDSIGGHHISHKEINLVLRLLNPKEKSVILEVGTGSGRFARAIVKSSSARVVGVDPDRKILREGKILKRIFLSREDKDRYTCVIGDGHALPFGNNTFDKVLCFRVIKYYKDPWKGIDELIRVLKPGGEMVLEITSNLSWESIVNPLLSFFIKRKQFHHFWEKKMINFNSISVKKYFMVRNMKITHEVFLHKMPPALYSKLNNPIINNILDAFESVLQYTPKRLFSKSIILRYKK